MRDGIGSLIELLASDPPLAGIALVEGLRAGRGVYDRYQAAVESFVPLLREGAPQAPGGREVPAATDEAIVGGIASLLGRRVLAGEGERLDELTPAVLEFALDALPRHGRGAANSLCWMSEAQSAGRGRPRGG